MLWSPAVGTALEEGEGGKLDAGGGGRVSGAKLLGKRRV